ncbi:MAG: endonuclease/exonuclease/phosphatase family protein [Pseudomonadota bacterium]
MKLEPMLGKHPAPAYDGGHPLWLLTILFAAGLCVLGVHLLNQYAHGDRINNRHQQPDLRVLSWNIGKIYLQWESRASDLDLEHIATVIKEANPQLVALQELKDSHQLGRLAKILGPKWRGNVPVDEYDRRAGLLVQIPARFIQLPTSTGRIAQGAIVTLPKGQEMVFVSIHLDAFDPERRLRQAEEILGGVQRLEIKETILAGDFNFDPNVNKRSDAPLYRFLTSQLVDAAKDEGGTTLSSQRLDYVFYGSRRIKRTRSYVLHERRINIMDHDPVFVEFFF